MTMTDLISRADAIDAVDRIKSTDNWQGAVIALLSSLPSAEAVQLRQTDTLIIAGALRYLAEDTERHPSDRTRAEELRKQFLQYGASMCHSADGTRGKEL